jgi:uncharacterized repeat protein (TIGR01451 family)
MLTQFTNRFGLKAALLGCLAALAGCASWQGPRIDPSGERFFIWPNNAPVAVAGAPVGAPMIAAPPPGATVIQAPPPIAPAAGIGAPLGNLQAPPVYSDPTPVPAPAAGSLAGPMGPNVIPPAVVAPGASVAAPLAPVAAPLVTTMRPAGVPGMATPIGACAPPGVRYLRLTPNGIMAPIGSEVVLKAGVADCDGSLLVGRSVEWGVAGTGQFPELGAPHQVGRFAWPWQGPRRLAANHAVGTTATSESILFSGTPDPNDDVPIYRGESWVTVTSACEGTSLVTAYTPTLENYNRVTVPIYWVDAQFLFPQSTTAEPGRPHVLTTTVLRRSDNAPLAGWSVRYDVARGASLGYEGGNFVEATTDAAGRASVEVSPVDAGGGTTNVGVSIYRPAVGGPGGTPPLGLGRGNATITWGTAAPALPSGPPAVIPVTPPPGVFAPQPPPMAEPFSPSAAPYSPYAPSPPPPSLPGGSPPATSPPPSQPNTAAPPPYTPPPGESTAGRAKLEVGVQLLTDPQVAVGQFARFEVVITNKGDATASRVAIRDAFPPGLRHEKAEPGATEIEFKGVGDIAPNQTKTVPLAFEVTAEGQQCHTATVTAENADPVSKQGCVTGVKPAFQSFEIIGPVSRTVGEKAEFKIVIKNGNLPASNVAVVLKFDPALEPVTSSDPNYQVLDDGSILLKVGEIVANEQRTFPPPAIEAICKSKNDAASVHADLTVGGAFVYADQWAVSILPAAEPGTGIFSP